MMNKKTIDTLTPCALVRFSKKTGKIDTTLTGLGYAMLNMWGLQNTTKTKETLVFTRDTGLLISHYTGDASGFPKVEWPENGETITELCPGLLEALAQ